MKFTHRLFMLFVMMLFAGISCLSSQSGPVKVKELLAKKPGILIDVRTLGEWNTGHHEMARHLDWNNGAFKQASADFDKSKTYYLYCASGGRSGQAAEYLKKAGFKNVVNLGGYNNLK
ncbi:MAG: rhodanese-like domain-containing protein [Saprospiraceae bacterium]|nr:rhodanese-like domain-containing protein [Candidatus Vicinibacter affinis]MBP6173679.1 rhodanese-like domain-containing protein [Saprospiraceae bacterium]MBK6571394.1 rhodanese-like domain-containing protein [Candidatus Vicinibacter affinis]MBK7304126.1 rhodanese-like domain-containing protein [Candidatus Vicinibacter affinis]MBK7696369.1 rhodanese-like domain-containing protein [Candidatus Vicinibacter affinis]